MNALAACRAGERDVSHLAFLVFGCLSFLKLSFYKIECRELRFVLLNMHKYSLLWIGKEILIRVFSKNAILSTENIHTVVLLSITIFDSRVDAFSLCIIGFLILKAVFCAYKASQEKIK